MAAGFLDDFEHTLALLKSYPEIGEPGGSNTRRLIFQRYPYTVVYRSKDKTQEIVAIAHHSRQPEYWTGRL
ncbi:MAG: type II toxin-antitoxin system RelE/ParE family toxin [Dechloromonas sp.]|uniref:Type II toxin-antitoxin system RelE/ParE family toxin n=1 Tax=Candidatus Dechloromonas phosphorivorans TaxID=2899244 RepID=A0A9D7LM53_9RHOO|nr:type II toxin-antitoxin system RelE/ParE family toxin [Candidatus Dechloromonas phosphorivorans]